MYIVLDLRKQKREFCASQVNFAAKIIGGTQHTLQSPRLRGDGVVFV